VEKQFASDMEFVTYRYSSRFDSDSHRGTAWGLQRILTTAAFGLGSCDGRDRRGDADL